MARAAMMATHATAFRGIIILDIRSVAVRAASAIAAIRHLNLSLIAGNRLESMRSSCVAADDNRQNQNMEHVAHEHNLALMPPVGNLRFL